ncbi:TetR family transcriptional regulator [Neoroseomonas lacus]|uniref:TetR family transcriptional regulator n=2 Tax=Neoroseomonas lacus TaxID=287609 RepID=A0A917NHJ9_9PROT|nr:TetR family transcriptional regulator [Neoroseomonas lacus]
MDRMTAPLKPRQAAKRQAILAAAGRLFMAEGLSGTSMDAVAREADVSKATLYAHIASKDALFGAVVTERCDAMAREAVALAGHGTSLREGLARFGAATLRFLVSPGTLAIYRIVMAEGPRAPGIAATFYEAGPMAGRRALAAWLADEQRRGRLDPTVDADVAAVDFAGLLRGDVWLRAGLGLGVPDDAALRAAAEHAAAVFCRAYGTVQAARTA